MSNPCCICLETHESPKALLCGHSYCSGPKNCLRKVLTSDPRCCSICREPIADIFISENDLSVNHDSKAAIEASQQSTSCADNQAGQDVCSVHKKAKKVYCNNCSISICEDCWNQSHLEHFVVPINSLLKDSTTASNESWKQVEQYQNNYKRLVTNSVDLNEEIVSTMEIIEKLTELKNKMQNAQNVQNFHTFEKKSLEELNEQKKVVDHIKSGISEMSNSCTAVENSLNKAIDTFSQSKITGSSQFTRALTGKATAIGVETWQLRDIRKGSATTFKFSIQQSKFSSQTQEVFALDDASDGILVLKVQGESIAMDRRMRLSFRGARVLRRSLWNRQIVFSIPCHGNHSVGRRDLT
ncbi:tripartite motif-containing protein 2-like isoform X2 [Symsagittifera roscoffensis]|uniref:tripartite motif-containing protein 2-like isoform X2 n=1 Tax=Symsagittifera roscoffensis TaxID=84072 RepID=UPI00307BFD80